MVRRLDGRVRKWVTLNEPWVITDGGYLHGALAPGHRNLFETPIASHNLMRAHGAAVRAYRSRSEEHTSELQSLMRISYAVFCLKKKTKSHTNDNETQHH